MTQTQRVERVQVVTDHLNDLAYAVRDEIRALRTWQDAELPADVREGVAISLDKLGRAYKQLFGMPVHD